MTPRHKHITTTDLAHFANEVNEKVRQEAMRRSQQNGTPIGDEAIITLTCILASTLGGLVAVLGKNCDEDAIHCMVVDIVTDIEAMPDR